MARNKRRLRSVPRFEDLESRALLSTGVTVPEFSTVQELQSDNSIVVGFLDKSMLDGGAGASTPGGRVTSTNTSGTAVIAFSQGTDLDAEVQKLESDPRVRYVERNRVVQILNSPDDPRYEELWGLSSAVSGAMNALQAWNVTTGSSTITVAVTDTGVDYNHPDLYLNIAVNQDELPVAMRDQVVDSNGDGLIDFYDFNSLDASRKPVLANGVPVNSGQVSDANGDGRISGLDLLVDSRWTDKLDQDGNGVVDDLIGIRYSGGVASNRPMDDHYHGTHVSGTIGAMGNNNVGVVGVNWNVRILPIKFVESNGKGILADAIRSIEYAADQGAQIINASWGDPGFSYALQDAVAYAGSKGAVFVAAAGNSSANNDQVAYMPANIRLPNVISVAALNPNGTMAGSSNYGPQTVDLAAPGNLILSTMPGGYYGYASGTSMAAPHVAGALALLLAEHPDLTPAEAVARVKDAAQPTPALLGRVLTGARLDAAAAVSSSTHIVDDGDAGWSATGVVSAVAGSGYAGDRRAIASGDTTSAVSWSFKVTAGRSYRLSTTWNAASGQSGNAPFEILVDGVRVGQVLVNQRVAPADFEKGGLRWHDLGDPIVVRGSTLEVRLTGAPDGAVIADAMRLEQVENPPTPLSVTIVDDGDAGWASSPGFASKSSLGGHDGDSRFSWAGTGSEWTSWTFAVTPGQRYRLSTTWMTHANRATDARYEIFVDGKLVGTTVLNQRVAASSFTEDGAWWEDLANGLVVDGTSLVVRVRNSSTGVVGTDAMRLEQVENPPTPLSVTIVDDGDAGWASSPGFASKSSLGGHDGDSRFSWAGTGSEWTSWTFAVTPGQSYRLSTTWMTHANRATDARYEILVDGKLVGTTVLNQRMAPSDFLEDSSMWEDLSNGLVVDGTSLEVRVRNSSTGVVGTDAMRLEPLTASRSPVETQVVDDGDNGWAGYGFASLSGLGGYDGDSRFSSAGNGSEWASWSFDVTAGATYQLAATWKAASNRASNTKFYVVVDGVILRSSQVNQKLNPDDAEDGGSFWEYLGGTIKARGSTLVVYMNNFANGAVGADAIRLDRVV